MQRPAKRMVMAALALACALGLRGAGGAGGAAPAAAPLPQAPDFTLTLLDGKTLRLSDLKGKPVVVNFWWSK